MSAAGGAPAFRFYGGKGGVGKTTCAAARALAAAAGGERVLAVSTDPAHSLGDALDVAVGAEPAPVPGAAGGGSLSAVELAAEPAFERWLGARRAAFAALAESGSLLTAEQAERLLALPIPGVDELLALLEVARLARRSGVDRVVVDTAPTAHTLRLLELPAALARLARVLDALDARRRTLAASFGGRPAAADPAVVEVERDAGEVARLLADPERAAFSWVLLPEVLSVRETADGLAALGRAGVAVVELVVNRVLRPHPGCPVCVARATAESAALADLATRFPGLPVVRVPELDREPRGTEALRAVAEALGAGTAMALEDLPGKLPGKLRGELSVEPGGEPRGEGERSAGGPAADRPAAPQPDARPAGDPRQGPPPAWLSRLAPPGVRLLFFGGKGGVGKTTCAAAVALAAAAADRRRPVHLLSTDPAHSLADVLDTELGDDERPIAGAPGRLTARELDAPRRWRTLRDELREETAGLLEWRGERGGATVSLDRELVDRLLEASPPGLDELMALASLIEAAEEEGDELRVIDTAATGHALRLLAMPEVALRWDHALLALLLEYRQAAHLGRLAEDLVALSRSLKRLSRTLADPARARFVVVTRAAELPRRESERLLAALDGLGIAAPAVVVNRLLVPGAGCPRCAAAAAAETSELAALGAGERAAGRDILLAPAAFPPPRGIAGLSAWLAGWRPGPPAGRPAPKPAPAHAPKPAPEPGTGKPAGGASSD